MLANLKHRAVKLTLMALLMLSAVYATADTKLMPGVLVVSLQAANGTENPLIIHSSLHNSTVTADADISIGDNQVKKFPLIYVNTKDNPQLIVKIHRQSQPDAICSITINISGYIDPYGNTAFYSKPKVAKIESAPGSKVACRVDLGNINSFNYSYQGSTKRVSQVAYIQILISNK